MAEPITSLASSDAGMPVVIDRVTVIGSLTKALDRLVAGQGGSVLIEGEAGIGKSLILEVAKQMAAWHGIPFLTASAEELDREFPLRTADLALASAGLRRERAAGPDGTWSPPAGDPVLAGVEAVLDRIDEIGAAGPLVFALDDLQWVDDASLLVLDRLSQAARQQPVLVLGAARPGSGPGRLAEVRRSLLRRSAELLYLDPLVSDDVAKMAALRVGGEPGPGLRRVLESTAGNPLFIRELVDALDRHGQLKAAAGAVDVAADPRHEPVVTSLEQVIAERISTLTSETVEVLRTAAVVGQEFGIPDLTAISGLDNPSLLGRLREALNAGILEEGTENTLRFRHGLIRDSLRASVPQAMRSILHATAASTLVAAGAPPERVGPHLLQISGPLPDWTAQWLAGAGSDLTYQTPAVAARLIETVLEQGVPDDRLWTGLTARLARSRFQEGEPLQAGETATRVLARTEDPDLAAEMAWLTAYARLRAADEDAVLAVLREAEQRWTVSPVWEVRLKSLRALAAATIGCRPDEGESLARQALSEATGLEDAFAAGHALLVLYLVVTDRGETEESLALLDQALGLVESDPACSDLRILLLGNRCRPLTDMNRTQEAAKGLELARSVAERTGSKRLRNIVMDMATMRYNEGSWDEALTDLLASIEDPDSFVPYENLAYGGGLAAMIHAYRGQSAAARRQLAEIDSLSGYVVPNDLVIPTQARAILAEQEQGPAAALAILEPTIEEDFQLPTTFWLETLPRVVRLARDTGRSEPVAKVRAILAAPDRGASNALIVATRLYCRALLDQDPEPGLEAARMLAESAIGLANCQADVAELLALTDRTRARQLLTEAVDRYEAMGAAPAAARAEARLRAVGIRLGARGARRRPATGWGALTPTEAEVAELVAEGLTNPEIAGRMFLSRRTVQTHVSHILAKLDVTTRTAVARAAAERHQD
ncbi:MAG: AAA family ATPase [Catenulispora sp.]|nr:AAA family ATPase [Catenulispora sp.]